MKVLEFLKNNIVLLDGGMGTLLQSAGLKAGERPEIWNITHPEVIQKIHCDYYNAGSNIVNTNTFGANILHFSEEELENIVKSAVYNAREAAKVSQGQNKFIALDVGPTGKLLKPYGDFDFEEAVEVFAKTVRLGVKYGVDLIMIETMNDSYETKAALLAAKENSDLPIFVSNAYGEDGKLMTGATPCAMVAMLEGMGADAIGVNCSLGPKQLAEVVEEYLEYSSVPVLLKPNAGLPKSIGGKTVFDVLPDDFSSDVKSLIEKGVRIAGGCCGTTPKYIEALSKAINGISLKPIEEKDISMVSSYTHTVIFDRKPVLIGERINPTGKKRLKQALKENDIDYILSEAVSQQEKGIHILDVNVGLPEIDEVAMLKKATFEIQSVSDLPLQIDTASPCAMEQALRLYNGKAMVNSVNGKAESMHAVFPLVKKYGGLVVALTLDDEGIPATVEGRVNIAKKILSVAAEYGIAKKNIIFDTLTMPISADINAASVTLGALKIISKDLGCKTSLGVSNVSFGLPNRDVVNGAFFMQALASGLDAAIMNPYSAEMMKTYHTYLALNGMDENCADYISFAENYIPDAVNTTPSAATKDECESLLQRSIIKGMKEQAVKLTTEHLQTYPALEIVQNEIIPALDIVGAGFEKNTVYLPQLLMAAEAAKAAFEVIKANMTQSAEYAQTKSAVVIATVKGDIHDIGKNIVKLLLENYGFAVSDLGKDVSPETVVEEVVRLHAPIVGLSALMTTTVPAMEETIKQLRKNAPWCKVVVGGAVLTEDYAMQIGADKYAKDAMETVRYAESI